MKFKKIKRMKMLKKGRREHIYIFSTVSEAENRRNSEKIILKRYQEEQPKAKWEEMSSQIENSYQVYKRIITHLQANHVKFQSIRDKVNTLKANRGKRHNNARKE